MTMTAQREFLVMAKPGGAVCNLDCRYCYYLQKRELFPDDDPCRMPPDLLEAYVVQHIEAAPGDHVHFEWHGGEPTVLGLDYFRTVVALQKKHQPRGRRITNGLQTNGTLLDEAWVQFLATEGFFVGLSLDGPEEMHDRFRVTRGQRPTHRQVVRAFRLLRQHGVRPDVLAVVHAANVGSPTAVYRFFKDLGVEFLQFLPLVERRDGSVRDRTARAEDVGEFLSTVFGEWVRHDIGRIVIQIVDEAARAVAGMPHALCIFRETCGDVPVVEHTGDFFSCDHFVDPAHRLGNIRDRHLAALVDSPAQRAFGTAKRATLPRYCLDCDVLALCNGGCPKDRIARTPDGEPGLNYLCAGFRRFFRTARPYLEELASLRRAGRSPDALMDRLRQARASGTTGRNDPCPCGSGLKFKRCCLGRI